jgi:hypothetical protein
MIEFDGYKYDIVYTGRDWYISKYSSKNHEISLVNTKGEFELITAKNAADIKSKVFKSKEEAESYMSGYMRGQKLKIYD